MHLQNEFCDKGTIVHEDMFFLLFDLHCDIDALTE